MHVSINMIRNHILDALPYVYPWYERFDDDTPGGVGWFDPEDGVVVRVDWQAIRDTVESLAGRDFGPASVNSRLLTRHRLDEVDFDSDSADVVLQLAAFGEVRYG